MPTLTLRCNAAPKWIIALVAVLTGMAVLGKPANLWLTEDQQAHRLESEGKSTDAAELYTDPL